MAFIYRFLCGADSRKPKISGEKYSSYVGEAEAKNPIRRMIRKLSGKSTKDPVIPISFTKRVLVDPPIIGGTCRSSVPGIVYTYFSGTAVNPPLNSGTGYATIPYSSPFTVKVVKKAGVGESVDVRISSMPKNPNPQTEKKLSCPSTGKDKVFQEDHVLLSFEAGSAAGHLGEQRSSITRTCNPELHPGNGQKESPLRPNRGKSEDYRESDENLEKHSSVPKSCKPEVLLTESQKHWLTYSRFCKSKALQEKGQSGASSLVVEYPSPSRISDSKGVQKIGQTEAPSCSKSSQPEVHQQKEQIGASLPANVPVLKVVEYPSSSKISDSKVVQKIGQTEAPSCSKSSQPEVHQEKEQTGASLPANVPVLKQAECSSSTSLRKPVAVPRYGRKKLQPSSKIDEPNVPQEKGQVGASVHTGSVSNHSQSLAKVLSPEKNAPRCSSKIYRPVPLPPVAIPVQSDISRPSYQNRTPSGFINHKTNPQFPSKRDPKMIGWMLDFGKIMPAIPQEEPAKELQKISYLLKLRNRVYGISANRRTPEEERALRYPLRESTRRKMLRKRKMSYDIN